MILFYSSSVAPKVTTVQREHTFGRDKTIICSTRRRLRSRYMNFSISHSKSQGSVSRHKVCLSCSNARKLLLEDEMYFKSKLQECSLCVLMAQ